MKIKNIIIARLKAWFTLYNEVHKEVIIPNSTYITGSKVSKNTILNESIKIDKSELFGNVSIGKETNVEQCNLIGEIAVGNNCKLHHCSLLGNVSIGNYTSLWGPNLDVASSVNFPVTIGNYCSIARNVTIQSFNHNFKKVTSYFIGQNFYKENWENERVGKGKITIQNDVWIGAHSVILSGVTIGNGAVVAANSVVNSDVEPYSIVGGTPAKLIGYRFEEEVIAILKSIEWWNWNEQEMLRNKDFFENEITVENLKSFKKQ